MLTLNQRASAWDKPSLIDKDQLLTPPVPSTDELLGCGKEEREGPKERPLFIPRIHGSFRFFLLSLG